MPGEVWLSGVALIARSAMMSFVLLGLGSTTLIGSLLDFRILCSSSSCLLIDLGNATHRISCLRLRLLSAFTHVLVELLSLRYSLSFKLFGGEVVIAWRKLLEGIVRAETIIFE